LWGRRTSSPFRSVKLGDLQGNQWAIREGLKAGDRVIIDGGQKAAPGRPVSIAPPSTRAPKR